MRVSETMGTVNGNDGVLVERDYPGLDALMSRWLPFDISAEAGKVTFRYGSEPPITRDIFDATAAWRRAKTLRVHNWTLSTDWISQRACFLMT